MKHAVLGAGGIGGFLGGALARMGNPVTLLVRPETVDRHPPMLSIASQVLGDFQTPVSLDHTLDEPVDVIWVTVKATQLDGALAVIPRDRVGGALIVPLLNGVEHMARLRSRYPADQVIAGTIRVEAERIAPGEIRQLSPFARVGLAAVGDAAARLDELAEELKSAGVACDVVDDEPSLLWGKLAFLAPLALTTTALDAPLGQVRRDSGWRARLEDCLGEACAVAALAGARIDRGAVWQLLEGAPHGMKSSMQKDVAAGRQPELDAIGGPIVRLAHEHGVNVPTTEALMTLIDSRVRPV